MAHHIGELVQWKIKRRKSHGMIIDIVKDLPETTIPRDKAYIIQQDNGYKLFLLETDLLEV